jgi:hypothetical protein
MIAQAAASYGVSSATSPPAPTHSASKAQRHPLRGQDPDPITVERVRFVGSSALSSDCRTRVEAIS